jgi:D-sedoheptulose 7-phosphate isomerase
METRIARYFQVLGSLPMITQASDAKGAAMSLAVMFEDMTKRISDVHAAGNKLMFVGNGGSAGIASHMAIDYSKNGNIRSTAFNDGAALTCLGNDLGYENVFAKQIDLHARAGDLLIAISSSGKSENILRAVKTAKERGCFVLTLSGFNGDNPLRKLGDINLFVDSGEYGFVELTHLSLCHAILDLNMGWGSKGISEEEKRLNAAQASAA